MDRIKRVIILAFLVVLGTQGWATASTWVFDFSGSDWNSPLWKLNGNAHWANDTSLTPNKRLRLTSNATIQSGTAWLLLPINPKQSWTIEVVGQFSHPNSHSNPNLVGGEGLAVIFQTRGTNALPVVGDFQPNTGTTMGKEWLSLNLDSQFTGTGIDLYTNQLEFAHAAAYPLHDGRLEGNFIFELIWSYDADLDFMQYTFRRQGFSDVTIWHGYNMDARFPTSSQAYLGFWGGTSAIGAEKHDVLSLKVTSPSLPVIPEPTSGLLVGAALAALACMARPARRLG